jgi:hypothetical protein
MISYPLRNVFSSLIRSLPGILALLAGLALSAASLAAPPTSGTYTFAGSKPAGGARILVTADNFFQLTSNDSANLFADAYGAFVQSATEVATSTTRYIEVSVNGGGSFRIDSAVIGDYWQTSMGSTSILRTNFTNVHAVGLFNGEVVATTPSFNSTNNYVTDYQLNFSSFSGKPLDTFRVYYTFIGATIQTAFNLESITISGASTSAPPSVTTTSPANNITGTSADLGGNVSADGGQSVTERGIAYHTAPSPTVANNKLAMGTGTGTFSQTVGSLSPGATYYARAYATNSVGTSYGAQLSFTTLEASFTAPTLTATGTNPTFTEDGSAVDLFSSVTADTNDASQAFTGMTLTVTNLSNGASEVLSIGDTSVTLNHGNSGSLSVGGSYAVSISSSTATVTLSGMTRSNAQMGTLVDELTYSNGSDNPGESSRVITIIGITDSGASNNSSAPNLAATVAVVSVNDVPTLSATALNPSFIQSGSAVDLFGSVTTSTVEADQTFVTLALTITNVLDTASEILTIGGENVALSAGNFHLPDLGTVTTSYSGTTALTVLDGLNLDDTQMATLIDGLSYRNTAAPPTSTSRVVTLSLLKDNGGTDNGGADSLSPALTSTISTELTPTVTASTVPADARYKAGHNLDFTVTYSADLTVVGTPYLPLTIGSQSVQAAYHSGSNSSTLTFRYTVVTGDDASDGIAIGAAIDLNGGTIRTSVGASAPLTSLGFPATTGVLVDGVAPTLTSVVRQSPATSSTNAASVTYRVTFSEPVDGVDSTDFTRTTVSGNVTGSVYATVPVNAAEYDVTIMYINGNGTLRLDLNEAVTITDAAGNSVVDGFTGGETYTIDTAAPTLPAANIVVDNRTSPHKVVLTFSKTLDADTIGAANAWSLTGLASDPIYSIASVALSNESTVTLTLEPVDLTNASTMITNANVAGHLEVKPPATLKDTVGNAYTAGTVTESGATHLLDATAPALSAASITASTPTTATLSITVSEEAWAYWIAVESGATEPNPSHVIGASDYVDVTVVASGYGALPAGAGTLALTNLPPVGDHDIHVVATDAAGNLSTAIASTMWTPPTAAPSVTTGASSSPGPTGATLNGSVDDEGLATTVTFEYGSTTAYGTSVTATTGGTIAEGTGSAAVSVTISGLACNADYHFRVVATNAAGTTHGNDETFRTSACPAPAPGSNPFNPGGTQTQTHLDPGAGIAPTPAPANIITNLGNLDNRVGISDNGVVVVLDNGLQEPVKFVATPPDNVLIAMPSQKPVDVLLDGETLNIQVDPETPSPLQQTILATTTHQLPDGSTVKGLQLVQGEVAIGNDAPNAPIGGMELSQDDTLRSVYAESGPGGGTAGFTKSPDGSGSVSAESGEVKVRVRRKGTSSRQGLALTLPNVAVTRAYADTTDEITLTLVTGEVARFDTRGELMGVFLGSLSGTAGKTGDVFAMRAPNGVAAYPATTLVFDGGNVPARLGMPFSDFLNDQLADQLHFVQRSDGIMEVTSPSGGKFYARAVRGFEVVPGAVDGPSSNTDGSLNLTYGGIRSTWQPMLEDAADLAGFFREQGFITEVFENGNVQLTSGITHFLVARPRHALRNDSSSSQGLASVAPGDSSLFYTNARGLQQQLDPAFQDEAQLRSAAAAQGWVLTRKGVGGNKLIVTSPDGTEYQVVPDFRVDVLSPDPGLHSVIRREGGKLYFYYADEPLRQGFTLK